MLDNAHRLRFAERAFWDGRLTGEQASIAWQLVCQSATSQSALIGDEPTNEERTVP